MCRAYVRITKASAVLKATYYFNMPGQAASSKLLLSAPSCYEVTTAVIAIKSSIACP